MVGSNLFGQNPYFNKIDKSVGLPSNTIYDITQDKKGFIWFATNEGICKYDGVSFTNLNTEKVTSKAGSSLVVGKNNKIFYCNFDGYIYYEKNKVLEPLPQNEPLGYNPICILNDFLLTTEKNNIVVYHTKTLQLVKKIPFNHSTFITATKGNNCYYILSDYLYCIDASLQLKKINLPEELKNNSEAKLIKYGGNKLYFFNKYQKKYFVYSANSFQKYDLPIDQDIIQNVSFVDDKIWLCTTNGIFKLNDENKVEHLFENYNISYFFKDSFKHYWICTLTEGVLLIPNFNTKIIPFPENITQFTRFQNDLLVSTEKNSIYSFQIDQNTSKKIIKNTDNHEIYLLKKVNDYYFSTSSKFRIYDAKMRLISEKKLAVKNIIAIDKKYFAVAASGFCGIFCFNEKLKSEWDEFYKNRKKEKDILNEVRIESNIKAKSIAYNTYNKTIYVSTNLGVISQTFRNKKTIFYKNKPLYINNLIAYKNLIFGINANGKLLQFNEKNKVTESTITHEEISKLKRIGTNLYLITKKNIIRYNLINKSKILVLTNNQEFDVADIEETKTQLLFATKKGIISKNLKDLNSEHNQFFLLNNITINGLVYDTFPTSLTHNQNNIKLNFSILNYNNNYTNPISYKINNNNWYSLENNSRNLILNELPPGNYSLKFKVYNSFTKKNDVLHYHFEIKYPFWKKPLFVIAVLTLFFGIGYFIVKNHIKKINQRNKEKLEKINLESELSKSKLTAIKSQMNPHFFFNALNTIQSYILTSDNKKALFYLKKFSVLTRNILEYSEKETICLKEEINTLGLYLEIEKARFNEEDFIFEIHTTQPDISENIKIPAMLIQPYIENAIKHGLLHKKGLKKLIISLTLKKNYLTIRIEDNGIGRKKSMELNLLKKGKPTSFATQAMNNRIELLNKNKSEKISIDYTDKETSTFDENGTIVTIKIPINL